jgi:hypothetical protein
MSKTPDIAQIPAVNPAPTRLTGIKIECHYPESVAEAAVPTEMTARQLHATLDYLLKTELQMTGFVVRANLAR